MSYSFGIRAANKADAKSKVMHELAKVAVSQPVHARDIHQAAAAANSMIDLIDTEPLKDIVVSVSGSLSGTYVGGELSTLGAANVSVSAYLADKQP